MTSSERQQEIKRMSANIRAITDFVERRDLRAKMDFATGGVILAIGRMDDPFAMVVELSTSGLVEAEPHEWVIPVLTNYWKQHQAELRRVEKSAKVDAKALIDKVSAH